MNMRSKQEELRLAKQKLAVYEGVIKNKISARNLQAERVARLMAELKDTPGENFIWLALQLTLKTQIYDDDASGTSTWNIIDTGKSWDEAFRIIQQVAEKYEDTISVEDFELDEERLVWIADDADISLPGFQTSIARFAIMPLSVNLNSLPIIDF